MDLTACGRASTGQWLRDLHQSVDSMPFFQRRRAAKWHQRVSSIVGETRPAPTSSSKENIHLFPYSQLKIVTKNYLGRWKRSQMEIDNLLLELIESHPCKEVALAACAADLSPLLVREVLETGFDVDEKSLTGLEAYLHAFVAGAQNTEGIFVENDQAFAGVLVPVVRALVNQTVIQPVCATALFSAWMNGPPEDLLLLSRTKLLTEKVCQRTEAELSHFLSGLSGGMILNRHSCDRVLQLKHALALLREGSVGLEQIVMRSLPQWRAWAAWTPSLARLHRWSAVAASAPLNCLLELEGPDLRPNGLQTNRCEWRGLIRDGEMLAWLEARGFNLGIGLITGDSEHLLRAFIPQFLHIAICASEKGADAVALLQLFIRKEGLDSHTLEAWQAAVAILRPQFVASMTTPEARHNNPELEVSLMQALEVLSDPLNKNVRVPLRQEIGECVQLAVSSLETSFQASQGIGDDWIPFADRLWTLREVVVSSDWLHGFVNDSIIGAGKAQPLVRSFVSLRDLQVSMQTAQSSLQLSIEAYLQAFVLFGNMGEAAGRDVLHELHMTWIQTTRSDSRNAALAIAEVSSLDVEHSCACIRKLKYVSADLVSDLQLCLTTSAQAQTHVSICVQMTRIIWTIMEQGQTDLCWRELLLTFLYERDASGNGPDFTSMGFKAYRQWIGQLHSILGPTYEQLYSAYSWICGSPLGEVESAIEHLEMLPKSQSAVHYILTATDAKTRMHFLEMLQCFRATVDAERKELMQYLILSLRGDDSHTAWARDAVCAISEVDKKGLRKCQNLIVVCHENREAAVPCLALWLRMPLVHTTARAALVKIGQVLGLGIEDDVNPPDDDYCPAKTEYLQRVARLVELSQHLEQARMTLKRKDPKGVNAMVTELNLEQLSGAATLMAELPGELVNVIEETDDDKIEFHFPLSLPELSGMERLAFGLKGSETLTVYLRLNGGDAIDGFCVHVEDNLAKSVPVEHTYFKMSRSYSAPEQLLCRNRMTRLRYVVARELWRQLRTGNCSLGTLYKHIQHFIHKSASLCIVCGRDLGASMHRGTLCDYPACNVAYRRSSLDLRVEEVRVDGGMVDILLASVYAAAAIKKLGLLPARPTRLDDAEKLLKLLNSLPATSALADAADVRAILGRCGERAELLFSWMLTCHRGFLISASGNYKIPNMGSVQQFLLVDGPPEVEAGFAKHNHLQPRHVLFHGTSMDRLYPVLAQGLRVLSGTPLQKHGAVHGSGIYLAREPSYALNFATKASHAKSSTSSSDFFESRSSLKYATVLLGCEHAGDDVGVRRSGQIHVITDPTRVMVRYIFLVPPGARVPKAQDIKIPMLSTFNSLRSTAVGKPT